LKEIAQSAREQHTYWSDLPLADLFALIERCRFFVGCDSGPTHAAAALQKPIVVVWGSSNFQAWHPWGTTFEVVRSNLPCMPCPGYSCEAFGEPKCIRDIPVERVAAACKKIGDAPLLHTADAGNEFFGSNGSRSQFPDDNPGRDIGKNGRFQNWKTGNKA
jgi:ADP-heptose:LPS heptosyltransferase